MAAAIASQELGSHLLQGRILALVRPLTGNDGSSTAVHLAQDALAIGCSDFHDLLLGNCCWPLSGGQKNSSFKKRWPVIRGASQDLYVAKNPYKLSIELCVCIYIYYLFIYCSFIYSFIYLYPQWVISDIWVIKLYINHLLSGICTHPSRFPYHDR